MHCMVLRQDCLRTRISRRKLSNGQAVSCTIAYCAISGWHSPTFFWSQSRMIL